MNQYGRRLELIIEHMRICDSILMRFAQISTHFRATSKFQHDVVSQVSEVLRISKREQRAIRNIRSAIFRAPRRDIETIDANIQHINNLLWSGGSQYWNYDVFMLLDALVYEGRLAGGEIVPVVRCNAPMHRRIRNIHSTRRT